MDGIHRAKVSKRGITERKRAKIEIPYLNAHLYINMNSQFTYLISRKSFKRSRKSSDNELFLIKTSKGCNPAIRGHIQKW